MANEGDRWARTVLHNASDMITVLETDGTIRYVSAAVERILGYRPEELVGTLTFDYVHPEDVEFVSSSFAEALENPGLMMPPIEFSLRTADGSWRNVEAIHNNLLEDSNVQGVVVDTRDITERKEAEERLRESEERFRLLAEIGRDFVFRYRFKPTPAHEYVSPWATTITGYTPEEYYADPQLGFKIVHPDDRHLLDEVLRSPESPITIRWRRKNGELVWSEQRNKPIYDEAGELVAIEGIGRDVTERKQAEEAQVRYAAVLEAATDFVGTATADGCALSLNRAGRRMVGIGEDEDISSTSLGAYHPEWAREIVLEQGVPAAVRNGVWSGETALVTRDGREVPVSQVIIAHKGSNGEVEYLSTIARDISEHKRYEVEQQRLVSVVEKSSDFIGIADLDGRAIYVNEAGQRLVGLNGIEEVRRTAVLDYFVPEDQAFVRDEVFPTLMEKGRWAGERELSFQHFMTGEPIPVIWDVFRIDDPRTGEPINIATVTRDITERKKAEETLRESEERFRSTFEEASIGMSVGELDGRLLQVNRSLCEMLGYSEEELLATTFQAITHPDDLEAELTHARRMIDGEIDSFQMEKRYFHAEGRIVWGSLNSSVVRDQEGRPLYFIGQVQDITERKRVEEQLRYQAFHDLLTGLPNRQLFVDRLQQALERTRRRAGHKVAVLFMDLDNFKIINDSLGHEIGDHLLSATGERLRKCLRPEDTLARFGGDEFTVLIEDADNPEDAVRVAERLIEALRVPFIVNGQELFLQPSIGIALGAGRTKSPEDLLRDADAAMYRAKEAGLGYRMFEPGMYEQALRRLKLASELQRAIEAEQFVVHYQPIVDLGSDEVCGVEALVRWNHPERGLLDPEEFVSVAEENDLVVRIGKQVLKEACEQAKRWQERHPRMPPLMMAVNLSARQLRRPDLASTVEKVLRETGLEAPCLSLDITETVYVKALEGNTAALAELKKLGVRISIDDFGTGYSSLAYLKRLPADILKIDKSFVAGLGEDVEDTAIMQMVIDLAHTFGMEVVAEGIESEEQVELLKGMGCDLAQGYHFAEPLPPEAVPEVFE